MTARGPLPGYYPNLLAIADSFEPQVRDIFLDAVTEVQRWFPLAELEAAIEAGALDSEYILDLLTLIIQDRMTPVLAPLVDVLADIAESVGAFERLNLGTAFDIVNPAVVNQIRWHGAGLVEDITDEVRDVVQRVVSSGWADGLPVSTQARLIRQVVGLNTRQADAHSRYGAGLKTKVDAGELDAGHAEHLTEQYGRRLLTARAETIARTETIDGSMTAQLAQWREQAEVGLLDGQRTKVEWRVTDDDRLCPYCAPMHGKVMDLFDDDFVSNTRGFPEGWFRNAGTVPPARSLRPDPYGQSRDNLGRFMTRIAKGKGLVVLKPGQVQEVEHPPLHPNCRCTLVLRFL